MTGHASGAQARAELVALIEKAFRPGRKIEGLLKGSFGFGKTSTLLVVTDLLARVGVRPVFIPAVKLGQSSFARRRGIRTTM